MISSILRIIETRSFKSLNFTRENLSFIDTNVNDIGLYVHIPFCKSLCSFCPYNKVKYDEGLAIEYKEALIKEIKLVGNKYKEKNITSIYFGGGTPALMVDELKDIIGVIKEIFNIECDMGIELHPRDVNKELLEKIKEIGFNMISLGIQSFQLKNLNVLGREWIDGEAVVKLASKVGFKVIDVDFIFGIKGETEEDLRKDFEIAFRSGATQVSTYPFIDFSYADNKDKPLNHKEKKKLLEVLEEMAEKYNLNRTSVWTFGKKDLPKYSSITRDSYIGFGPSAASLTNSYFKINTFSVEEYIKALNKEINPKALTFNFEGRMRMLYWLFWNSYTLELNKKGFRDLFNREIEEVFGIEITLGRIFGLLSKEIDSYNLTKRGSYIYHLLEQHYTHQYIDKTWNVCRENPWPNEIKLY